MKEPFINGNTIVCTCGNRFTATLAEELAEELSGDSFEDRYEEDREYECESCGANYNLFVLVTKTISIEEQSLTVLDRTEIDLYGNRFNLGQLKNAVIDDEVPLEDGQYENSGYFYVIENQTLTGVFSAKTDESQMSLF